MNTEQNASREDKSTYRCSLILLSIFNTIVFLCGTVLLAMNFFCSGNRFEPCVTLLALAMLLVPVCFHLFLLIRCVKQK